MPSSVFQPTFPPCLPCPAPPSGGAADDARLGALLALHHSVSALGLAVVPYSLLVVVPLMGRMSDAQPLARALAARTFATVVALMPLAQASGGRRGGACCKCTRSKLDPCFSVLCQGSSRLPLPPVSVPSANSVPLCHPPAGRGRAPRAERGAACPAGFRGPLPAAAAGQQQHGRLPAARQVSQGGRSRAAFVQGLWVDGGGSYASTHSPRPLSLSSLLSTAGPLPLRSTPLRSSTAPGLALLAYPPTQPTQPTHPHSSHAPTTAPTPRRINGSLRRYQQEGINWLAFLRRFGLHGVLADDMGLGESVGRKGRTGGGCHLGGRLTPEGERCCTSERALFLLGARKSTSTPSCQPSPSRLAGKTLQTTAMVAAHAHEQRLKFAQTGWCALGLASGRAGRQAGACAAQRSMRACGRRCLRCTSTPGALPSH